MKPLPELTDFLEGLSEPHILFDAQYRILAANAAYRRAFSPDRSVIGRTCYEVSHRFQVPCDQAGESCPLAQARASGQRERVLHLHHTPKGEEYVDIELTPLRDASGEQAFFVEKMASLKVAHSRSVARGLIGRSAVFQHMMSLVARVAPSMATVLLLVASLFIGWRLARSKFGRVLTALRDAENRLMFCGYDPRGFKLFVWVLSAVLCGLAGALYVPQVGIINPSEMSPTNSIEAAVWVALGGRGTLIGPLLGAGLVNGMKSWFTVAFPEYWLFFLGALFIVVTLYLPKGVIGLMKKRGEQ